MYGKHEQGGTDDTYFKGMPQNVGCLDAARPSGDTSTGDWLSRRPDDLLDKLSRAAGGRRGARRGLGEGMAGILGDDGTERTDG